MSKCASFSKNEIQSIKVLRDLGLGDHSIARYLRIDISLLGSPAGRYAQESQDKVGS